MNNIRQYIVLIFIISVSMNIYAQKEIQRPPANDGPTKIKITTAILNINEINTALQTITMNVVFSAEWNDTRLVHEGPLNLVKPLDEIWNPRLVIVNRQNLINTMPETAEISPNGTVIYTQRVIGQFTQTLDFSDFPFDKQKFIIRLAAQGFSPEEIEFNIDSVQQSISKELSTMDWDIIDVKSISKPYFIISGEKSVASLKVEISANRNSSYYIFNFVVPLVLIILMSIAVFWLDPTMAAPQISLASTSMLTLIAYRFMIIGSLPKITYLTRMDVFIFCSTILIFITLFEAVLTINLGTINKKMLAHKIDFHSRWVFPLLYFFIYAISFLLW